MSRARKKRASTGPCLWPVTTHFFLNHTSLLKLLRLGPETDRLRRRILHRILDALARLFGHFHMLWTFPQRSCQQKDPIHRNRYSPLKIHSIKAIGAMNFHSGVRQHPNGMRIDNISLYGAFHEPLTGVRSARIFLRQGASTKKGGWI